MASTYPASAGAPASTQRSVRSLRRAAFVALAAFILLGPAPGQLFGVHSILLREWLMFSGAGVGLAKGQFTLHRAEGAVTMSPLEVLALPTYLALPLDRRIYKPSDLKTFAARICDSGRETARLSFEGSVAAFIGWRALTAYDICNHPAQAHYSDARP
jgi:hypothetical protein